MRFSLKSAITLLLVMSIAAGILLYPARASCIDIIQKDSDSKSIDPSGEPNIHCGEPGYDPNNKTVPLGSGLGTSLDTQPSDPLNPDNRGNKTARSRYMQLLFSYLRNISHGQLRY